MKFDIPTERFEEFKNYLAVSLTKETGKLYTPENIFIADNYATDKVNYYFLKNDDKFRYIFANVDLHNYNKDSVADLEFVSGNLFFQENKELKSLGSIKHVRGDLLLGYSVLKDLGKLTTVGGDAQFRDTNLKDKQFENHRRRCNLYWFRNKKFKKSSDNRREWKFQ